MHAPTAPKVMLIRHAEKPPPHGVTAEGARDPASLVVRGWQRAGALATLFAPARGPLQSAWLATPQFVYATRVDGPDHSKRPQETIGPLVATVPGVTIDFTFAKEQVEQVAAAALAQPGVVLICWQRERIPDIAAHIPASRDNETPVPRKWPDDRFDLVWVFDRDSSQQGRYLFHVVAQLLLGGDRTA